MASTGIRRTLGWVVVASLCVAAAVAAVAIVGGSFDRTDGYVVVTSLGFAVQRDGGGRRRARPARRDAARRRRVHVGRVGSRVRAPAVLVIALLLTTALARTVGR